MDLDGIKKILGRKFKSECTRYENYYLKAAKLALEGDRRKTARFRLLAANVLCQFLAQQPKSHLPSKLHERKVILMQIVSDYEAVIQQLRQCQPLIEQDKQNIERLNGIVEDYKVLREQTSNAWYIAQRKERPQGIAEYYAEIDKLKENINKRNLRKINYYHTLIITKLWQCFPTIKTPTEQYRVIIEIKSNIYDAIQTLADNESYTSDNSNYIAWQQMLNEYCTLDSEIFASIVRAMEKPFTSYKEIMDRNTAKMIINTIPISIKLTQDTKNLEGKINHHKYLINRYNQAINLLSAISDPKEEEDEDNIAAWKHCVALYEEELAKLKKQDELAKLKKHRRVPKSKAPINSPKPPEPKPTIKTIPPIPLNEMKPTASASYSNLPKPKKQFFKAISNRFLPKGPTRTQRSPSFSGFSTPRGDISSIKLGS